MSYTVTLLIFGILLLLVGLVGEVKAKELEIGTSSKIVRIVLSLIGIFLVMLSLVLSSSPDTVKNYFKQNNHPAGSFQKNDNNGTVSCSTYCRKVKADGTPEWGAKIGTCVEAKNESSGQSIPCDTVPGLIPDGKQLTCTCR